MNKIKSSNTFNSFINKIQRKQHISGQQLFTIAFELFFFVVFFFHFVQRSHWSNAQSSVCTAKTRNFLQLDCRCMRAWVYKLCVDVNTSCDTHMQPNSLRLFRQRRVRARQRLMSASASFSFYAIGFIEFVSSVPMVESLGGYFSRFFFFSYSLILSRSLACICFRQIYFSFVTRLLLCSDFGRIYIDLFEFGIENVCY